MKNKNVTAEQEFENKMLNLLPGIDAECVQKLVAYARELDGEAIPIKEFLTNTYSEFYLVKQGYGEKTTRMLLDICKTTALNPFELRGAAYHLHNGVEPSKIGQLAIDGKCDPPNGEPFPTDEAMQAFEAGRLYNCSLGFESE